MQTTQQNFHPQRGHMEDGTTIECDNGDTLTLRSAMKGWYLVDAAGNRIGDITNDAYLITRYVMGYGQETSVPNSVLDTAPGA